MKSKKEESFLGKKHNIIIKISKDEKPSKIKGPWSLEEENLLKEWVKENGPKKWKECAKTIYGRNQVQCRQHWNISLQPNLLVGNWSSEDLFLIMVFYKKLNGSWKKIIPLFKSRTENSIKNIFFSQTRAIVSKIRNEKNDMAFDFAIQYQGHESDFITLVNDTSLKVPGTFLQTWSFIQKDNNSLHRHSNFHLLFKDVK